MEITNGARAPSRVRHIFWSLAYSQCFLSCASALQTGASSFARHADVDEAVAAMLLVAIVTAATLVAVSPLRHLLRVKRASAAACVRSARAKQRRRRQKLHTNKIPVTGLTDSSAPRSASTPRDNFIADAHRGRLASAVGPGSGEPYMDPDGVVNATTVRDDCEVTVAPERDVGNQAAENNSAQNSRDVPMIENIFGKRHARRHPHGTAGLLPDRPRKIHDENLNSANQIPNSKTQDPVIAMDGVHEDDFLVDRRSVKLMEIAEFQHDKTFLVSRIVLLVTGFAVSAYLIALYVDFCLAVDDDLRRITKLWDAQLPTPNPSRVWGMHTDLDEGVVRWMLYVTAAFVVIECILHLVAANLFEIFEIVRPGLLRLENDAARLGFTGLLGCGCCCTGLQDENTMLDAGPMTRHDSFLVDSSSLPPPTSVGSSAPASNPKVDLFGEAHSRHRAFRGYINVVRSRKTGVFVLVAVLFAVLGILGYAVHVVRRCRFLGNERILKLRSEDVAANSSLVDNVATVNTVDRMQNITCFKKDSLSSRCKVTPTLASNLSACVIANGESSAGFATCLAGPNVRTGRPAIPLREIFDFVVKKAKLSRSALRDALGFGIFCLVSTVAIPLLWAMALFIFGAPMCCVTFWFAGALCVIPAIIVLLNVSHRLTKSELHDIFTVILDPFAPAPSLQPLSVYVVSGPGAAAGVLVRTAAAALLADCVVLLTAALLNPRDVLLGVERLSRMTSMT